MTTIKPQPKQIEFLSSSADIVIFGGAAGGGKTYALHLLALQQALKARNLITIFRRTTPEIKQSGGLWDESMELYPLAGGVPKSHTLQWDFPLNRSKIKFNGLQYEKDLHNYQGAQIPVIMLDELTHFSESKFWYMIGRNRLPSSVSGVRPIIRATCNPDPDSFVAKMVSWYIHQDSGYAIPARSGVVKFFIRKNDEMIWGDSASEVVEKTSCEPLRVKSFSFIYSELSDNTAMSIKNPSYRSNLLAQDEVQQERLLHGNWKIRQVGNIFKECKFKSLPKDLSMIGWVDPSYSGSDTTSFTIGCRHEDKFFIKGWVWPDSIIDLYELIAETAKNNNVGTIIFERNGDKGLAAQQFAKYYDAISSHHESQNKHLKIMGNLYKNWNRIFIDPDSDSGYVNQILGYTENKGLDDAPDSASSLVRKLSIVSSGFGGGEAY